MGWQEPWQQATGPGPAGSQQGGRWELPPRDGTEPQVLLPGVITYFIAVYWVKWQHFSPGMEPMFEKQRWILTVNQKRFLLTLFLCRQTSILLQDDYWRKEKQKKEKKYLKMKNGKAPIGKIFVVQPAIFEVQHGLLTGEANSCHGEGDQMRPC